MPELGPGPKLDRPVLYLGYFCFLAGSNNPSFFFFRLFWCHVHRDVTVVELKWVLSCLGTNCQVKPLKWYRGPCDLWTLEVWWNHLAWPRSGGHSWDSSVNESVSDCFPSLGLCMACSWCHEDADDPGQKKRFPTSALKWSRMDIFTDSCVRIRMIVGMDMRWELWSMYSFWALFLCSTERWQLKHSIVGHCSLLVADLGQFNTRVLPR